MVSCFSQPSRASGVVHRLGVSKVYSRIENQDPESIRAASRGDRSFYSKDSQSSGLIRPYLTKTVYEIR